jgi:TIR domain
VNRFGAEQVFMDVDTIALGEDFTKAIADAVGACDVLLAVIGPNWLSVTASDGKRRLENPHDFVRLEIKSALKRDVRVIPTLVHGAEIPASGELPRDLAPLSKRNGIQLRSDSWGYGVGQLIEAIEKLAGAKAPPPSGPAKGRASARPTTLADVSKAAKPPPSQKRSTPPSLDFLSLSSLKHSYQVRTAITSTDTDLDLDVVVGAKTHVVRIPRKPLIFDVFGLTIQVDGSPVIGTKQLFPDPDPKILLLRSRDLGAKQDVPPTETTWWSYPLKFKDGLRDIAGSLQLRTYPEPTLFPQLSAPRSLGSKSVVLEARLELDGQWLYWSR